MNNLIFLVTLSSSLVLTGCVKAEPQPNRHCKTVYTDTLHDKYIPSMPARTPEEVSAAAQRRAIHQAECNRR